MIARLLAGSGAVGTVFAVSIFGPGQFGFPYMGMFAGIGALFIPFAVKAPVLMFVLPLLSIAVMIAYVAWSVFTVVIFAIRAFQNTPTSLVRWAEVWCPLVLSIVMIAGLILLRAYPGQQEVPVEFQNVHFAYPVFLALLAISLMLLDKGAEQARPANLASLGG